jgi:hypothetical protein
VFLELTGRSIEEDEDEDESLAGTVAGPGGEVAD